MISNMDLRKTFDEDAERYDRFRPTYPAALFDALIGVTGISAGSSLLEIGPGTGQATRPLAQIGANITAIELGGELAEKARQELRDFSNVQIIKSSFEAVTLPAAHYEVIYSATAFHWVKDAYKFIKTARLLKPQGYLAIIHTEHVSDNAGDDFYAASQPIYDAYWPPQKHQHVSALPTLQNVKAPYIDTALFEHRFFKVFTEIKIYSAHEYAGLLSTYSPIIALSPAKRRSFLNDIEKLINERFDGQLKKSFAFTLTIAQKN
jgi:ubiquinone/menaquinone biosynthesis C-methylase UbiE